MRFFMLWMTVFLCSLIYGVQIHMEVSVPLDSRGDIFIAGNIDAMGPWNPGKCKMHKTGLYCYTASFDVQKGKPLEFKFTRGSWQTVEMGKDKKHIQNRVLIPEENKVYKYTVANWSDLCKEEQNMALVFPEMNVPEWAKSAIWYQIFVERFSCGKKNVSKTEKLYDVAEKYPGWHLSSWRKEWYHKDGWEKEYFGTQGFPRSIFSRYYGGDLVGVKEKIPYLKELGITAVYFNPLFWAESSHKYDSNCYHHIDPFFGPEPQKDFELIANARETEDPKTWIWTHADRYFLALVKELHENDIRVIIDGVFNHTGRKHFAFQDILKNGQKSPYKDWYKITGWDQSNADGFTYEGWFGVHSLPEFRQVGDDLSPGPKQYVFDSISRWMKPEIAPEAGIDGWRLDVAYCIGMDFWEDFRKEVKRLNPEAYIVAEIVEVEPKWFTRKTFDAFMNYPFGHAVREFFLEKNLSSKAFLDKLVRLQKQYPAPVYSVMQNLYGSHDTPRFASQIVNPDCASSDWGMFFNQSQIQQSADYQVRKPVAFERELQKLMLVMQFTSLGTPFIYYGDEAGMWGANDPCCRKPMVWENLSYQSETLSGTGDKNRKDSVAFDRELFSFYQKIIQLRKSESALNMGDFTVLSKKEDALVIFSRSDQNSDIVVCLNATDRQQSYLLHDSGYTCIFTISGDMVTPDDKEVYLPPYQAAVFKRVREARP